MDDRFWVIFHRHGEVAARKGVGPVEGSWTIVDLKFELLEQKHPSNKLGVGMFLVEQRGKSLVVSVQVKREIPEVFLELGDSPYGTKALELR